MIARSRDRTVVRARGGTNAHGRERPVVGDAITMAAMPSPRSGRRLRRGLAVAVVALVVAGGVAAFVLVHAPGNVSHPNLQFTQPTTTAAPAPVKHTVLDNFSWPWFGYSAGRTRDFPGPPRLHPPLHVGWRFNDGALLEFPPVIYHRALYLLDDNASAKAIRTTDGSVLWKRKLGTLSAASPAVAARQGLVLMPILSTTGHGQIPGDGRFVALSMRTGRIVWSRPLSAGSESSPIVDGSTAYFGDQSGTLYALRIRDGHLDWTYHAGGPIKGGPALVAGVLYFGDYSGHAYAIRAATGHQVWAVGTDGAHFGFGSGQFYSSPAVAFGRVYMGNTDGRMYSFGARTGALAWATATGAYVYGSAAVANPPGLGPTVYVGSYDGHMYAFDAKSGAIRWAHPAGGKISGAATVVGRVLYYSDLGSRTSAGLDVVTGRQLFSFPDGAFNPVVADYEAIYLDGYGQIYQLLAGGPVIRRPLGRRRPAARRGRGQRRPGGSSRRRP